MAYSKQTWVRGEKVASVKLNHMEDGIAAISANGAVTTAKIADGAVTAAKLDESATDIVADTFSTSKAYSAGDYVIYSGALYRFTADKVAGAWDSTKVVAVALADDVADLKSALNNIAVPVLYNGIDTTDVTENGYWNYGYNGNFAGNNAYNACNKYVLIDPEKTYTAWLYGIGGAFSANKSCLVCWYDANKTFISGNGYVSTFTPPQNAKYARISYQKAYSFVWKEGTEPPAAYVGYSYPPVIKEGVVYHRLSEDETILAQKANATEVVDDDFNVVKPITNIIANGNFSSISAWSVNNGVMTISNNELIATGNGTNKDITAVHSSTMPIAPGEKYYFHAKVKVTNNDCKQIRVRTCGDYGSFVIDNPMGDKWYDVYSLCTIPNNATAGNAYTMFVRHTYEDATTANGKSCKVQNCMMISLNTDFGLGENPPEYLIKRLLVRSGYIDGTQDVVIKNSHDDLMLRIDEGHDFKLDYVPPRQTRPRKACVSFVCDDGYLADYTKLRRFSEEYNAPFTSALYKNSTMPVSVRLFLQDDFGWEFASHTYNHSWVEGGVTKYLDDLTEDQLEYEFSESRRSIEEQGLKCNTLVYPNGRSSELVRRVAKRYFKCACTTNRGYNDGAVASFYLNRYPLGAFASGELRTLEGLKAVVDQANADNSWLIFMLHPADEVNQGGHTAEQNVIIGQLIQYINSIGVDIKTFTDAYDEFANTLEAGDYIGSTGGIAISGTGLTANL